MKLNIFNGGLNHRLSPFAVNVNQSIQCTNVDTDEGPLKSMAKPLAMPATMQKYFTMFRDRIVDFTNYSDMVKHENNLYICTDTHTPQVMLPNMSTKDLNVLKPANLSLSVASHIVPTVSLYEGYDLWIEFRERPDTNSTLIKGKAYTYEFMSYTNNAYTNLFKYTHILTDDDVHLEIQVHCTKKTDVLLHTCRVHSNGDLYRIDQDFTNEVRTFTYVDDHDDATHYDWVNDVVDEVLAPGTYQYAITHYDTTLGWESAPLYSDKIDLTSMRIKSIDLYFGYNTSLAIRIYRIGGLSASWDLITTIIDGSTYYTDDTLVSDNIEVLTTQDYIAAPQGKYPAFFNSMLFIANENTLYFSDIGKYWAWNKNNWIKFSDTITGLGVLNQGLIIFTLTQMYMLSGTCPANFVKSLIDANIGAIAHKTIKAYRNGLLWVGLNGIYFYQSGNLQNLTRDILGSYKVRNLTQEAADCDNTYSCISLGAIEMAEIYDDVYYVLEPIKQRLLLIDFKFNALKFKHLSVANIDSLGSISTSTSQHMVFRTDTNYCTELFEINKSDDAPEHMDLHYLSPKFSDGSLSNLKSYKSIYINYTGTFTIKVLIDDIVVNTFNLTSTKIKVDELKLAVAKQRGKYIQFDIVGKGTIYEIEYKVMARQNGK